MKIRPVGAELFIADRRTDMTKLIVVFRNFAKAPESTAKPWRPQMTKQSMRIACWITKTTGTYTEYLIPIAFHSNNGYTNAH